MKSRNAFRNDRILEVMVQYPRATTTSSITSASRILPDVSQHNKGVKQSSLSSVHAFYQRGGGKGDSRGA